MKTILFVVIALILVSSAISTQFAAASKKSPYESGYDHGCSDARISNPSDRYINQYEKGPAFHTDEFMNGYNNGYNACSGGSIPLQQPSQSQAQSSNNENNNNNALSQSQNTNIYICNEGKCVPQ